MSSSGLRVEHQEIGFLTGRERAHLRRASCTPRRLVAATITCIGVMPALSMLSSSCCSDIPKQMIFEAGIGAQRDPRVRLRQLRDTALQDGVLRALRSMAADSVSHTFSSSARSPAAAPIPASASSADRRPSANVEAPCTCSTRAQVRHDVDVVLHDRRDERIVHLLVAHEVNERRRCRRPPDRRRRCDRTRAR